MSGLHAYSVNDILNTTERTQVLYKLAAASSFLVGVIGALIAWMTAQWALAVGLTAPATVVVYLFSVRLVELHLWEWGPARDLLGISLPNINGQWNGVVETRRRDGVQIAGNTGVMTIRQTWSTIGVAFETNKTISYSVGAFLTQGPSHLVLTIEYQADVREPQKDDDQVQAHKGTSTFRIPMNGREHDLSKIEVPYYTDHRETGIIRLTLAMNAA